MSEVLGRLGFTESFTFGDIKLALGLLTVAIAGILFAVEKKYSFDDGYKTTVALVTLYFVISGVLLYFTSGKYKNIKYIGNNDESNTKVEIVTWTEKYDPLYHLKIRINGEEKVSKIEFMKVFDSFGGYQENELVELIGKEIDKVGRKRE